MENKHIGVTPDDKFTREDCSQEAKKLFKEVKRILYELVLEGLEGNCLKLELFRRGSKD